MKSMTFLEFSAIRDDSSMRLIDVRELEEYEAVRVKGAELFSLSRLRQGERFESDGRDVYIICRSGARSALAGSILESEGYPECTNISDGTNGALEAGPEYVERW